MQRPGRDHFTIETIWPSGRINIGCVVGTGHRAQTNSLSHDRRVKQRTISSDPDDDLRATCLCRAGVAIEDVVFRAAMHRNTVCPAPGGESVVGGCRGCRDPHLVDAQGRARGAHDPGDNRAAGKIGKHLTGQSGRTHTCLDDGDGFHIAFRTACSFSRIAENHSIASDFNAVPRASARRALRPRTFGSSRGAKP